MIAFWMGWLGCAGDPTIQPTDTTTTPTAASSDTATTTPCTATEPGEVCTSSGMVIGVQHASHWRWQGIPYAAPPVGARRFLPPAPVDPWAEPLMADARGAVCPQWDLDTDPPTVMGDEDCLTLNVFAPDGAVNAPVLVFVHGGGHQQGDSGSELATGEILYDGTTLAEQHGAVLVTMNYRLGPFGFLALPSLAEEGVGSGNFGMMDQVAALDWVAENIAAFGGDPDRVMLFGESAGSVSVCRLLVSPAAAGRFTAVGMQSGGCTATPRDVAEATGQRFAAEAGCPDASPACLRERTVDQWMAAVPSEIDISAVGALSFSGVIDGELVPDAPRTMIESGLASDVPVLLGTNADETGSSVGAIPSPEAYEAAVGAWAAAAGAPNLATLLLSAYPLKDYDSPRDAYVALTSDAKFNCGNRRDARLLRDAFDSPVYRYRFDQIPENGTLTTRILGAYHGLELFYLFDQVDQFFELGASDVATQQAMGAGWTGMAETGSPGASWAEFTDEESLTFLSNGLAIGADPRDAACDFWDSLTAEP